MNNIYYSHARLSTNMKNYFWKKVVNIKKKSIVKMAAFFMFNIGGWWSRVVMTGETELY